MDKTRGHAAAIITIFVWGVTFISTKILLTGFLPVEILFCRFVIGYLALFAICPRLLFMLPALYIFGFTPDLTRFYNPAYLFNILFLGLGASAMCFVTWNYAVKVLGAVKTSAYIYAVPVLTVASAVIVLNEPVTVKMLAGGVLIILGLLLSQKA